MSFILDALKKSENDRQRRAGPGLYEVRMAPPRPRFPIWAIVVAALLAVNALVVSGWLWIRAASGATALPSVARALPPPVAPLATVAPGIVAPAAPAAVAPTIASSAAVASTPRDPELAVLDGAAEAVPPEAGAGRADNEPAVEMPAAERTAAGAARVSAEELPTRDELHSPAIASLPELRLDLHVYDPNPLKRFVLINMHRLREGETLPEGVRVDRITAEGAELEYQGTRFFLAHE
jgi:general secretion pathway protein B